MARISNRDRVLDIVDGMNKKLQGSVATLLETIVELSASEDLSDLEESTASSSRRDKAKKGKKTEKVKSKRKSKKDEEDDEDEAPKKRGRKAKADKADKAEKKSKRSKPEPFDGTPTLDDCYDFLSEFEGEPVEGGIRELKPEVKKLGGDPDVLTEDAETRAEKAEELGMFLAANKALMAKLKLHDENDISDLAEELGIDTDKVKSKNKQIAAILVALNSEANEEDEDEEDEDEAPKKRKSKKEKPSKKGSKRKSKSKKDDEDEEDEDEEDEDEDDEDEEDGDEEDEDEDEDDDGLDDIDDIDDDE